MVGYFSIALQTVILYKSGLVFYALPQKQSMVNNCLQKLNWQRQSTENTKKSDNTEWNLSCSTN